MIKKSLRLSNWPIIYLKNKTCFHCLHLWSTCVSCSLSWWPKIWSSAGKNVDLLYIKRWLVTGRAHFLIQLITQQVFSTPKISDSWYQYCASPSIILASRQLCSGSFINMNKHVWLVIVGKTPKSSLCPRLKAKDHWRTSSDSDFWLKKDYIWKFSLSSPQEVCSHPTLS